MYVYMDSVHIPGETVDEAGEGDHHTANQKESAQVGNSNSNGQEKVTGVKVVGRIRRIPVTRTDDFLWTGNCRTYSR
jgi:hypothetical protein